MQMKTLKESILGGIDIRGAVDSARMEDVCGDEKSGKPLVPWTLRQPSSYPTIKNNVLVLGPDWGIDRDLHKWGLFKDTFPDVKKIDASRKSIRLTRAFCKDPSLTGDNFVKEIESDGIEVMWAESIRDVTMNAVDVHLRTVTLKNTHINTRHLTIISDEPLNKPEKCELRANNIFIEGIMPDWLWKALDIKEFATLDDAIKALKTTDKIEIMPRKNPLNILRSLGIYAAYMSCSQWDCKILINKDKITFSRK